MSELEKRAYELCLAIEQLPASEYQTKLAIMASDLLQNIRASVSGENIIVPTRCKICNSIIGWHHENCPEYVPAAQQSVNPT